MSSGRLAVLFKYKTFSAVLNCRENRTLCSLAPVNKWHMFSSDITQAFTYGKLDVPLFCDPPPGFECPEGTVLGLTIVFMELNRPQQVSKVL